MNIYMFVIENKYAYTLTAFVCAASAVDAKACLTKDKTSIPGFFVSNPEGDKLVWATTKLGVADETIEPNTIIYYHDDSGD